MSSSLVTKLPRESLPVLTAEEIAKVGDELIGQSVQELARDARELLGYKGLTDDVTKRQDGGRGVVADGAKLRAVLHQLDIKPFRTASVEQFMKNRLWWDSGKCTGWMLFSLLGFTALSMIAWWLAVPQSSPFILAGLIASSMTVAYAHARGYVGEGVRYFDDFQWRYLEIAQYERPIPEFALETAVRIKKLLPEARFGVHYLERDPLLAVRFGKSEELYLEQWDEPKFRVKREV